MHGRAGNGRMVNDAVVPEPLNQSPRVTARALFRSGRRRLRSGSPAAPNGGRPDRCCAWTARQGLRAYPHVLDRCCDPSIASDTYVLLVDTIERLLSFGAANDDQL